MMSQKRKERYERNDMEKKGTPFRRIIKSEVDPETGRLEQIHATRGKRSYETVTSKAKRIQKYGQ